MTALELLQHTCGRDINGDPLATVGLCLSMVSGTEDDPEKNVIEELVSLTCDVSLMPSDSLIAINLRFESYLDMDLQDFWDIINQYVDLVKNTTPEDESSPLLELLILPRELSGEVCLLGINPSFTVLTSDNPKEEHNHIIALAFKAETNFFISEPEGFNVSAHLAAAEREAEYRLAMKEMDEIAEMKKSSVNEYVDDEEFMEFKHDDDENNNQRKRHY